VLKAALSDSPLELVLEEEFIPARKVGPLVLLLLVLLGLLIIGALILGHNISHAFYF
jgi:hypothetical protein